MKTVRVALVMGGGVSLGSFSGGALSRCLKELHKLNERDDLNIEIDVVAGASAGSLTLGLALHTLSDPGGGITKVKTRQEQAWVQRIGMKDLTRKPKNGTWRSLLNREVVDDIAIEMMEWQEGQIPAPALLAKRVIFTSSMTNLNGLAVDVREELSEEINLMGSQALADPLTITFHKDPRVFDLAFDPSLPPLPFPHRRPDLTSQEGWLEIAGTAVASGAFPFAFEPVPLLRYKDEYDPAKVAEWRPYHDNDDAVSPDGPMLMSYADGGIIDNEPVEQALQHTRFLDFDDDGNLLPDFERLVIFIDPRIDGHLPQERLTAHADLKLTSNGEGIAELDTLGRVLGHGTSSLNALRRQSINRTWTLDPQSLMNGYGKKLTLLGIGPVGTDERLRPLAGAGMSGFKGFLDKRFRTDDFKWGEFLAAKWIRQVPMLNEHLPAPNLPKPPPVGDIEPKDFEALVARANNLAKEIDLGAVQFLPLPIAFMRWMGGYAFIKQTLRNALEESLPPGQTIEVSIRVRRLSIRSLGRGETGLTGAKKDLISRQKVVFNGKSFNLKTAFLLPAKGYDPAPVAPHLIFQGNGDISLTVIARYTPVGYSPGPGRAKMRRKNIRVVLEQERFRPALEKALAMSHGRITIEIDLSNQTHPDVTRIDAEETLKPWKG